MWRIKTWFLNLHTIQPICIAAMYKATVLGMWSRQPEMVSSLPDVTWFNVLSFRDRFLFSSNTCNLECVQQHHYSCYLQKKHSKWNPMNNSAMPNICLVSVFLLVTEKRKWTDEGYGFLPDESLTGGTLRRPYRMVLVFLVLFIVVRCSSPYISNSTLNCGGLVSVHRVRVNTLADKDSKSHPLKCDMSWVVAAAGYGEEVRCFHGEWNGWYKGGKKLASYSL